MLLAEGPQECIEALVLLYPRVGGCLQGVRAPAAPDTPAPGVGVEGGGPATVAEVAPVRLVGINALDVRDHRAVQRQLVATQPERAGRLVQRDDDLPGSAGAAYETEVDPGPVTVVVGSDPVQVDGDQQHVLDRDSVAKGDLLQIVQSVGADGAV